MRFLKRINEGWSDDYVTDFSDNGFTISKETVNYLILQLVNIKSISKSIISN
jgi:hypothetical protein